MRILRYLVLVIALIFWGAGLSTTVAHWLYSLNVIVDDYRFGDLYRLSTLPQFKVKQPECPPSHRSSDTASTHLYLIGDSFSEPQRLGQSDFRVSHFDRVAWERPERIQLDPTKRNVLLIESVERHVREHFARPVTEFVVEADTSQTPTPRPAWYKRIYADFHRTDVEERLESALFSRDWAFWVKELKAKLTLDWFGRAYTSVSLSNDRRHVFLHSDTDTTKAKVLNSSFSPLSDQEVSKLVAHINATADQYRKLGFDAVYLSLIPNKASILEPNRGAYNHLIERIQTDPTLRVPVINTYDAFRQNASAVYLKSDTHWTCEGRAIWLDRVRQTLGI
ncbi:hypothetical protein [Spirosoma koreense]